MAQSLKVPAAKPHDMSSIFGTHLVERTDFCKLPADLYTHVAACMHAHTHAYRDVYMLNK